MPGLNHKQKAFALHYAVGEHAGNATQAAIAAGYSPRSAADQGHRLSTNAEIAAISQAHRDKIVAKVEVRGEEILTAVKELAYSDVVELFNNNDAKCESCGRGEPGTLKNLADIPKAIRRAIKKIKFTELFEGASGEKFCAGRIVEIELWSKETGLVKLGENVGLWKTKDEKQIDASLAELLALAMKPEP